jgi:hypothetical protein
VVLTKSELVGSLQNEVRILLHLASKIDRSKVDYRPTPKQRSTLELLQYLSIMGPSLVKAAKLGKFDAEVWSAAEKTAFARNLDETLAAIKQQTTDYSTLFTDFSDAELREEVEMFGQKSTRGAVLVNLVLSGCAAYRTQLFLYLKACGGEELSTMNLWAGADAPAATPIGN